MITSLLLSGRLVPEPSPTWTQTRSSPTVLSRSSVVSLVPNRCILMTMSIFLNHQTIPSHLSCTSPQYSRSTSAYSLSLLPLLMYLMLREPNSMILSRSAEPILRMPLLWLLVKNSLVMCTSFVIAICVSNRPCKTSMRLLRVVPPLVLASTPLRALLSKSQKI